MVRIKIFHRLWDDTKTYYTNVVTNKKKTIDEKRKNQTNSMYQWPYAADYSPPITRSLSLLHVHVPSAQLLLYHTQSVG